MAPTFTNTSSKRVLLVGEILCDLFVAQNETLQNATRLDVRTGGAVANVAVHLAKQGHDSYLMSATGDDPFGALTRAHLKRAGVDLSLTNTLSHRATGAVFVEGDGLGGRRFVPMRQNAADGDIDSSQWAQGQRFDLLHTGTVSMRPNTLSRTTTLACLKRAQKEEIAISVDVNLRAKMFASEQDLKESAERALSFATLAKMTDQEARFLFGSDDKEQIFARLPALEILCISREENPATLATKSDECSFSPQALANLVDTTGAGDAFFARILHAYLSDADAFKSQTQMKNLLRSACEAGTKTCTFVGAWSPIV